jgi:hypothetical protein
METVLYVVVGLLTAWWQFNRTIRWGYRSERAILDAIIAGIFFPFAWIAWVVRRPYHK